MAKSLLKSAPIKKKRSFTPRGFDAKYLGQEPTWENQHLVDESERQSMLGGAYNWYNYFYEAKSGRKWLVEYMTEQGMSKAAVSMLNRVSDTKLSSTMCNTARMLSMGLEDKKLQDKLNNYLVAAVEQGIAIAKAEKAAAAKLAPAYDRNPAADLIATIEEMIDHDPDEEWRNSFYSWLKDTKQVKPTQARAIADYYRPWFEELREVATTKDAELKYAYRHLNRKKLKERIALFTGIVNDCESLVSNSRKVVTRKPRKTKPKTADKVVSKIKFQKEDTNLKIVSVDPTKIVGSSELWVFNTKYNVLSHYIADTGGLSMKGTTLQNVSETSKQKKLRKPADILPKITGSTPKAAERAFTAINTKENNPNGRINEYCIILRAVK
jgi:hypothetical protein